MVFQREEREDSEKVSPLKQALKTSMNEKYGAKVKNTINITQNPKETFRAKLFLQVYLKRTKKRPKHPLVTRLNPLKPLPLLPLQPKPQPNQQTQLLEKISIQLFCLFSCSINSVAATH